MIKTIIFDFGGVCSSNIWSRDEVKKFIKSLRVTAENFERARVKHWPHWKTGKIHGGEFWKRMEKDLNVKIGTKKRDGLVTSVVMDKNVLDLINSLKKSYRIIGLTNISKEVYEHVVDKFGIDRYFDFVVCSCHVGLAKPDNKIFKLTLKRLNLNPEECIFIDDKKRAIDAAKKLKMKTILFKNVEQLKRKLKNLKIDF